MPSLEWGGNRWAVSSDFLPVNATLGLISHAIWFIIAGLLFIIAKPHTCRSDKGSRLLNSVFDGTLIIMAVSAILEIPMIIYGLRGISHPAPRAEDAQSTTNSVSVMCSTLCNTRIKAQSPITDAPQIMSWRRIKLHIWAMSATCRRTFRSVQACTDRYSALGSGGNVGCPGPLQLCGLSTPHK